ncbi:hypothetical protein VTK73DRAFT_7739 [Phialemonium thermophilum]|uniref:Aminoglycoside phosphotransferase domain-containing protein n=1 Tax=Phialemonium thermophilum TaxID=223376 RepID=A0ABR3WCU6_9PEZI
MASPINNTQSTSPSQWDDCPNCAKRKKLEERKAEILSRLKNRQNGGGPQQNPRTPSGAEILLESFGRARVKLYPDGSVVKVGGSEDEFRAEAAALRLATEMGLRAPALRGHEISEADVQSGLGGRLVMDYVPGETLDKAWPRLSEDDRRNIALDLRNLLDKMRSQTGPRASPYQISSCSGGPIRIARPIAVLKGGPFPDEHAFNRWVVDVLRRSHTPPPLLEALSSRFQSHHRVVLTHGDLAPRNIVVREGRLAGLVDWGFAGWLPEYMEYAVFFLTNHQFPYWTSLAGEIFGEHYDDEWLHWQAVSNYLTSD